MMETFALTELDRRIANLIQIGTVIEADYDKARLKVKIGGIVTDWLPWLTSRAGNDRTWWSPEINEQAVVLAPSGELNQAVILPALYQQVHPAPEHNPDICKTVYQDGTTITYDRASHELMIDVHSGGKIVLRVGSASVVISDTGVKIEGERVELN